MTTKANLVQKITLAATYPERIELLEEIAQSEVQGSVLSQTAEDFVQPAVGAQVEVVFDSVAWMVADAEQIIRIARSWDGGVTTQGGLYEVISVSSEDSTAAIQLSVALDSEEGDTVLSGAYCVSSSSYVSNTARPSLTVAELAALDLSATESSSAEFENGTDPWTVWPDVHFKTVAEMQGWLDENYGSLIDGQRVSVIGGATSGDGGGKEFYWDADGTTSAVVGSIYAPSGGEDGRLVNYKNLQFPTLAAAREATHVAEYDRMKIRGDDRDFELTFGTSPEAGNPFQGMNIDSAIADHYWKVLNAGEIFLHRFETVGDGVTDDAPQIQAWLDCLKSIPGSRGAVDLEKGPYAFGSALTLDRSAETDKTGHHISAYAGQVRIDTSGGGFTAAVFIALPSLADDAFTITSWQGGSLNGFSFDLGAQTGGDGIVLSSCQFVTLRDPAPFKPYSDGIFVSSGNGVKIIDPLPWGRWQTSPGQRKEVGSITDDGGDISVNIVGHGFEDGAQTFFATEGTLPGNVVQTATYYVISSATDSFKISTSSGGSAVAYSSAGSGTLYCTNWDQRVGGDIVASDANQVGIKLWGSDAYIEGGRSAYFTTGISGINGNNEIKSIRVDFNKGDGISLLSNSEFYNVHDVIADQNGGSGLLWVGTDHDIDITAFNNGRDTRLSLSERAGIGFKGTYDGVYNAGTEYDTWRIVKSGNRFWQSLQGANTGNTPVAGSAYWVEVSQHKNIIHDSWTGNKPNGEVNIGWQSQQYGIYCFASAFGLLADTNTYQFNAIRDLAFAETGEYSPFSFPNSVKVGGRALVLEYIKNNIAAGLSGSEMVPPSGIGARRALANRAFLDSILVTTNGAAVANSATAITSVDATANTFTLTAHGLVDNYMVLMTTTGTLPDPIETGTYYFVTGATANTFQLSENPGGSAIDLTDVGSGTHSFRLIQFIAIRAKIDGAGDGFFYIDAETAQRTSFSAEPHRIDIPEGVDFNLTVSTPSTFTPTTIDINVSAVLVEY